MTEVISQELEKVYQSRTFTTNTSIWEHCIESAFPGGLFLEFGVWHGYSINYMSALRPDTRFYGFDSFQGLPEFWREGYDAGTFKLEELPQLNENVGLVVGLFQDTLGPFLEMHEGPISFCHIDCDLHSSARFVLDTARERFVPGTIILFDEYYNYPGFENGELKAFVDFVAASGIAYEYIGYNTSHEQVAVKIG